MKNIAIGILLITTVVFGGLYVRQSRKAGEAQTTIAGLEQKVTEAEASLAEQEKQTASLRDQLRDTRTDAIARAAALAKAQALAKASEPVQPAPGPASLAQADAPTNAKPSNPFGALFKNQEMRDMIKTQQKAVLGTMLEKNYAKLIADLHLTPEQSTALKDLIMNKQLANTEMGMSMLGEDMDATKRAELVQQIKTQNEATDAQIKQLLGDDNYAQFQAYEKTQGERMTVNSFKDQVGSGPMALSADQEQQLIQAMSQERQNSKFTTDYNDQTKFTGDFASYFTEEKLNQFSQEQERLNQQYLARAQGILSADQVPAFQKFLTNQQEMQKAAMKIAAQLFAPKSGGN